ncbi:MAG: hypothetical protein RLZZ15_2138 [Verrucomicrobiota bacterium]|jgi:hypothetical protein
MVPDVPPPRRSFTPNEASTADFWRQLCPDLALEGNVSPPAARLDDLAGLGRLVREEGYVNTPGVLDPAAVARTRSGVERLAARGIPPVFAWVYDECWLLYRSLQPFLAHVLGADYRMLPDVWAWFVKPSNDAAGWVPHRDRSAQTFDDDGSARALTVWLPLTDTTPLNGCIYILPPHVDPGLHAAGGPLEPADGKYHFAGDAVQNIRALPAPAGSLLAWHQSLLHWGSRASRLGANPRCSIAAQFQRADVAPYETPLLDPHVLPPFSQRLGLIGHLICMFSGFLSLPPETRALGTALQWKYWKKPAR